MSSPGKRDITRVVAARFISRAGGVAAFFIGVQGKAAFQLHATASQLALLMFVLAVSTIVGSIVGGVLVDRHGPRRVLVLSELLFVPAALIIPLANTMIAFTALVALYALAEAPVVTAASSFAPFLAGNDPSELKRINSLIDSAGSLAFVLGPAVGAIIVRYVSPDWLFALDAATSLVAAVLVWGMVLPAPASGARDGHPLAELREGLRTAYGLRAVRFYVLGGTLVWFCFGAFGALEPLFYRDVVRTGVQMIGWMNACFGLGMLTGAAILRALPRRILTASFATLVMVATGLGTILYVGSTDLRLIAAGALAWGLIIGLVEPLLRTLLHRDTPRPLIGRVMGTSETHRRAGELVPLAFAPALAARFGVQPTLIGGGVVCALIALTGLPAARSIDRSRRDSAELITLEPLTDADDPKVLQR